MSVCIQVVLGISLEQRRLEQQTNNRPPGGKDDYDYDYEQRPPADIAAIVKDKPRHAARSERTPRARSIIAYAAAMAVFAAGLAVVGIADPSVLKTSTASGSFAAVIAVLVCEQ